jgi:hypothetical protein
LAQKFGKNFFLQYKAAKLKKETSCALLNSEMERHSLGEHATQNTVCITQPEQYTESAPFKTHIDSE